VIPYAFRGISWQATTELLTRSRKRTAEHQRPCPQSPRTCEGTDRRHVPRRRDGL